MPTFVKKLDFVIDNPYNVIIFFTNYKRIHFYRKLFLFLTLNLRIKNKQISKIKKNIVFLSSCFFLKFYKSYQSLVFNCLIHSYQMIFEKLFQGFKFSQGFYKNNFF